MNAWRHRAVLPEQLWFHRQLVRLGQVLPNGPAREPNSCDLVGSGVAGWGYVGIPLTGSRTVIASLRLREEPDHWRTRGVPAQEVRDGGVLAGKTLFAFVGNPWRRVVSCYNKKILNCNTPAKVAMLSRHPGLSPGMAFDQWVEWLCSESGQDDRADPHWCSQWRFIVDERGSCFVGNLGRSERLSDDLEIFAERLSIPLPEIRTRRRSSEMPIGPKYEKYTEFFNDRLANLIARRYEHDIHRFGYEFGT